MGVILLLITFSEILIPQGVQVLIEEECDEVNISMGIEFNPGYKITEKAEYLFENRGYNFLYLKNADSLEAVKRFLHLLENDSLFIWKEKSGIDFLSLVMNDFSKSISPVISMTVGITGNVDFKSATRIFEPVEDSSVAMGSLPEYFKPVYGKHLYPGNENYLVNISPPPDSKDFIPFLISLQIIRSRGLNIRFSPETAPSPFKIFFRNKRFSNILKVPTEKEVKKSTGNIERWLDGKTRKENLADLLVMIGSMGVDLNVIDGWRKNIDEVEMEFIKNTWERYFLDGFIASADTVLMRQIINVFPEACIRHEN